jgi:NitT/TauT family transport system permease protein
MARLKSLKVLGPIAVFVVLMAGWYGYVRLFSIPSMILPLPGEIAESTWSMLKSGLLARHFMVTAKEVVFGFFFGVLFGLLLGTPIALSRTFETVFYPYLLGLQTMPKVALAPLMMIWAGNGIASKVIITTIVALFPVLVNVIVGLRSIDPDRIALVRSLKGGIWSELMLVRLPTAAPFIFAGMKTAVVLSLLGAITAEFVSAEAGLGYLMSQLMYRLDTAGVFSVLLVLALVGVTLFLGADWLQKRLVFWDTSQDEAIGR